MGSSGGAGSDVTHPERGDGPARMRRHRAAYGVTTSVLLVLAVLAVLDVPFGVFGVDTGTVADRAATGEALTVEYTAVTRPALASPFTVEVESPGGFDGPIVIAVSRPWIEVWDENGLYPSPDGETGDPDWVVYEFEPPDGDTFRVFYDARLEPARQESVAGVVELRRDDEAIASVRFETKVRP